MFLWVVVETPMRSRTTNLAPGDHVATVVPIAIGLLAAILRVEGGAEVELLTALFAPHVRHFQ